MPDPTLRGIVARHNERTRIANDGGADFDMLYEAEADNFALIALVREARAYVIAWAALAPDDGPAPGCAGFLARLVEPKEQETQG